MKTCPQCLNTYADSNAFCPRDGAVLSVVGGLSAGATFQRKFRIIEIIGEGGMGVVYRAQHTLLKEDRALKLINARYSDDPQAVRRFLAEALLANQIDHPNVARIYDADETDDGQPYIVMEYVPGVSLREILRPRDARQQIPLSPLRTIQIGMQVCAALATAHAKQIIHRDIKPDNILIAKTADGGDLVKVVDFGIAKAKKELQETSAGTMSLSQTGLFVGTPQYSSPEQASGFKGDSLDHRTDLYSLGMVLYEMLTGQLPFSGGVSEVLHQQKDVLPPSPLTTRPDLKLPEKIVALTLKALSKDPSQRYSSADEMRAALDVVRVEILRPPETPVPPPPPTVVTPATVIVQKTTMVPATIPVRPERTKPTPPRIAVPAPSQRSKFVMVLREDRIKKIVFASVLMIGLIVWYVNIQWGPVPEPVSDPPTTQPVERLVQPKTESKTQPDTPSRTQATPTPATPSRQLQVRNMLATAKQRFQAGAYDEAINLYKQVQALDPGNAEASNGIKTTDAAKRAEERLNVPERDISQIIRQAQTLIDNGEYDQAIGFLKAEWQRTPQDTRLLNAIQRAQSAKEAEERIFGKR